MDTISLHQHGISTAVGISGTALTLEHVQFIKRLTKNIYLCLDGDSAGIKATFSSMEALENQEVNTKIIQLPNGKDPDEYLQSGGIWAEAESKALSPIAYTLQQLTHQFDITTVTGKTAAAKHLMEKVSRIQNRIEADVYIREIAQLLQLTPEILYAEYKQQKFPTRATIKKNETKKRELCEDIIGYLAAY
jgi:DNA primase